jgi:galactokinase
MPPITTYAPGRAELLGNHTDYNEGYVLALAVDRGVTLTGRRRDDRMIRLHSENLDRTETVSLDHLASEKVAGWSRYPLGVVDQFRRHEIPVDGFDAEISGDLPQGAGLSSSAALENATVLLLLQLFGGQLKPLQIAQFSQRAEHDFVGVRCGLLDQLASLMSRAGAATFIDCRSFAVDHVALPPDVSVIIADSGVKHALEEGDYNSRRTDCEAAARALGATMLRDVSRAKLEAEKGRLADRIYRRALHVVGENERVLAGVAALRQGDIAQFGRLMYASHESSRIQFENSCPELDELVETARRTPGVWGARLSGGGFGGATINLVEKGREDEVVKALGAVRPGAGCLITSAADGALHDARNR